MEGRKEIRDKTARQGKFGIICEIDVKRHESTEQDIYIYRYNTILYTIRTGTVPKLAGGVISLVLFPAFESSSRVLEVIIVEESTILASPKSQI